MRLSHAFRIKHVKREKITFVLYNSKYSFTEYMKPVMLLILETII